MNTGQLKAIWNQFKANLLVHWGRATGNAEAVRIGERERLLARAEEGFAISRRQEMEELQAFLNHSPRLHKR